MTATCLNTNGIEAVLRICCCASGSIVFHGRKTTALSLTVSTALKLMSSGAAVKDTRGADLWASVGFRALPSDPLRAFRRGCAGGHLTTCPLTSRVTAAGACHIA